MRYIGVSPVHVLFCTSGSAFIAIARELCQAFGRWLLYQACEILLCAVQAHSRVACSVYVRYRVRKKGLRLACLPARPISECQHHANLFVPSIINPRPLSFCNTHKPTTLATDLPSRSRQRLRRSRRALVVCWTYGSRWALQCSGHGITAMARPSSPFTHSE